MYVIKRIFILLFFVFCLNIFLSAVINKDEEWPDLFSGEDILIVVKDLDGGIEEYIVEFYDERLLDPDSLFDVRWWLMKSFKDGYGKSRYDKKIADQLFESIRQIAWKVQEKIDNCKFLQDMYGDQIKGKEKYPISFQYYRDNACGDTMGRSVRVNNILLHKILKRYRGTNEKWGGGYSS